MSAAVTAKDRHDKRKRIVSIRIDRDEELGTDDNVGGQVPARNLSGQRPVEPLNEPMARLLGERSSAQKSMDLVQPPVRSRSPRRPTWGVLGTGPPPVPLGRKKTPEPNAVASGVSGAGVVPKRKTRGGDSLRSDGHVRKKKPRREKPSSTDSQVANGDGGSGSAPLAAEVPVPKEGAAQAGHVSDVAVVAVSEEPTSVIVATSVVAPTAATSTAIAATVPAVEPVPSAAASSGEPSRVSVQAAVAEPSAAPLVEIAVAVAPVAVRSSVAVVMPPEVDGPAPSAALCPARVSDVADASSSSGSTDASTSSSSSTSSSCSDFAGPLATPAAATSAITPESTAAALAEASAPPKPLFTASHPLLGLHPAASLRVALVESELCFTSAERAQHSDASAPSLSFLLSWSPPHASGVDFLVSEFALQTTAPQPAVYADLSFGFTAAASGAVCISELDALARRLSGLVGSSSCGPGFLLDDSISPRAHIQRFVSTLWQHLLWLPKGEAIDLTLDGIDWRRVTETTAPNPEAIFATLQSDLGQALDTLLQHDPVFQAGLLTAIDAAAADSLPAHPESDAATGDEFVLSFHRVRWEERRSIAIGADAGTAPKPVMLSWIERDAAVLVTLHCTRETVLHAQRSMAVFGLPTHAAKLFAVERANWAASAAALQRDCESWRRLQQKRPAARESVTLPDQRGMLGKQSPLGLLAKWQQRYFVLSPAHGTLTYYKSESAARKEPHVHKGAITLASVASVVLSSESGRHVLTLEPRDAATRAYRLAARSEDEQRQWADAIAAAAASMSPDGGEKADPAAAAYQQMISSVLGVVAATMRTRDAWAMGDGSA
eukprot:c11864_g1_i1.p1 GENE.c11864_g1_i1~~c11864_g1_i1.p1  ORF type:complete len:857 (+),score=84.94 c11864_g1_i1:69-2573(+)